MYQACIEIEQIRRQRSLLHEFSVRVITLRETLVIDLDETTIINLYIRFNIDFATSRFLLILNILGQIQILFLY
jgi:hypothetical protein